jgi:hypothetical protein
MSINSHQHFNSSIPEIDYNKITYFKFKKKDQDLAHTIIHFYFLFYLNKNILRSFLKKYQYHLNMNL